MAATTLFHRKKFPRRKYREIAELGARGRETVRVNATLLRIAESLDRSHQGIVSAANFTRDEKGKLFLDVACGDDCQLEMWGVAKHRDTFKKVFGKTFKARLLDAAPTA
jgi:exopolyphosphatase/guanosine-5'-triphosphate,3'-diphosphate pyrophosphatase